ncbi:MAG: hypothetical protein ACOCUI_02505 [bacterium]
MNRVRLKNDAEFWRNVLVKNCKLCKGTGYKSKDEATGSVELCKCNRMVRLFVKMNDPEHGLNPKYHKWTLRNLFAFSDETKKDISKYIKNVVNSSNPYRNLVIKGGKNSGKSSAASIIYKALMTREYEVSIIQFSEIVTLSRLFMSNSNAFNTRWDFYNLLKEEEFIIIEDVDNRGSSSSKNFERLGYGLLDEVFAYRANHPARSTVDEQIKINESTMGRAFYSSIYASDVEDDSIIEINLIARGEDGND